MSPHAQAVVFDLGGVLVDWDPRHLYRKLFDDAAEMEHFLATICSREWHAEHDRGRPFSAGIEDLTRQHPDYAPLIAAYQSRWEEMFQGAIEGSVEILESVRDAGRPTYALTNFPAEKFPSFRERFPFVESFDGVMVSGEEGLIKPDPAIYERLLARFGLVAEETVFIDDTPANVYAAKGLGIRAIPFTSPADLRRQLRAEGIV